MIYTSQTALIILFLLITQFSLAQTESPKKFSSDFGFGYGQTYLFTENEELTSQNFKVFQTFEYQVISNMKLGIILGVDYIRSNNDAADIQETQVPISFSNKFSINKERGLIRNLRFGFGYNIPIHTSYTVGDSNQDLYPIHDDQIGSHPFVQARVGFGIRNKEKKDLLRWEIGYAYKRLNTILPYSNDFIEAVLLISVF